MIHFANETEPWPDELGTPQFFDANRSVKFLVGGESKIFQDICCTIVASSKIFMRVKVPCSDGHGYRTKYCLLPGRILMGLMGWPACVDLVDVDNSELMTSFAGNAFSGCPRCLGGRMMT